MQVISGSKRGAKLKTIEGTDTRPTASRMKEAIFNVIQFELEGRVFCDLFAGSGSIGIEALSRGAKHAVFVDSNKDCVKTIGENLSHTKFSDSAEVLCMDCCGAVELFGKARKQFDIIYIDPPYDSGQYRKTAESIVKNGILSSVGIIIMELRSRAALPDFSGLSVKKRKDYGTTSFVILEETK